MTTKERIEKYKELLGQRSNFDSYWQDLHNYFYIESPDINTTYLAGTELNTTKLYDSTSLETADVLASGFMNYLTPPTSKWFKLAPANHTLFDDKAVSDYLEEVEEAVYHTLNKSNFYDQMYPAYKSSGVYGTSILLEEEDLEDGIRFRNIPIKQCVMVEDARGKVAEYYIEFEYTAYQAALRWGKEKLSQPLQEELNKNERQKKHKFLLYIGVRTIRDVKKKSKEHLPIEALWMECDSERVVEEGGYNEFPVMTHRFDKRPFIPWGFSPAMKALSFTRMLNQIAKTNLRAMMKRTDPPVALPHNAFIMPLNANPRAINYYRKTAMDGQKDIVSFGADGDPNAGLAAVEYYTGKVRSLMYHDVFLAFEHITKQMQNPEVQERINEKMTMLGPAVGRYTGEVLNPIIIRTIGILARQGRLPEPPEALIEDGRYEIDYVSQLAQAQKRSELNALTSGMTIAGQMAQFAPEVIDRINSDNAIKKTWDILGAPVKVLRDDREVAEIREQRAQMQAQAQELEMAQAGAKAGKDLAQAEDAIASASSKRRFE